jgi:hypothetical protein
MILPGRLAASLQERYRDTGGDSFSGLVLNRPKKYIYLLI